MKGHFEHSNVRLHWTVEEDGESDETGGKNWVLQVRMVDVSVSRWYPVRISKIEAEQEARVVAPMLLQVAGDWLK